MPLTLAMYDKSHEHIGARLAALDLDITVRTFGKDGLFDIDGVSTPPADVAVDYFWLSSHVNADGSRKTAFDTVLACKSVGVLQTFNAGLDDPVYKKISARGTRHAARASSTAAPRRSQSPSSCLRTY